MEYIIFSLVVGIVPIVKLKYNEENFYSALCGSIWNT